jgi:PilZ domain
MPGNSEPRFRVDLPIRVFGVDDDDRLFSQIAHTKDLSSHGARLVGLKGHLKAGDIIGVHFGDKKARLNVIRVVDAGQVQKTEAGVKVVEGQLCPWQEEAGEQEAIGTAPILRTTPKPDEKRKFPRRRIPFQIEVQGGQGGDPPMRTRTADIAGSGCYIETMLPLAVGKIVSITFWLNSERVRTMAIVRTCDRGIGMGIEFTGLDKENQKSLQQQVEAIAVESAEIGSGAEITDVWVHR